MRDLIKNIQASDRRHRDHNEPWSFQNSQIQPIDTSNSLESPKDLKDLSKIPEKQH